MIHRVKPTRRRRIEDSQFVISLNEPDSTGIPTFEAKLDLSELAVNPEGEVVVVAYRKRRAMRFNWGTVSNPSVPQERRLTEVPHNPLFKLMILDPVGSGLILASRDRIKPNTPEGAPSMLWLEESSELGNEVWKLNFENEVPTVLVNSEIEGISGEARQNGKFRALVLPQAVRSVLRHALIDEEFAHDDLDGVWSEWVSFVSNFYAEEIPGHTGDDAYDRAEKSKWIDDAVTAFTSQQFDASRIYRSEAGRQ